MQWQNDVYLSLDQAYHMHVYI